MLPAGADENLFGKIYTYEQLQGIEKPQKEKPDWARNLAIPDHWPQDGTTVEPGKWVFWLPDGWGQGVKPTAGGKTLQCYVSPPPMRRFFHKPKVAEYCAKMGWPGLKEEEKEEKGEKKIRTVHDTFPGWPEWELPRTWRVGLKQLPSGPHKIYIPPGQDEGFLYHRTCVEQYLSEGKVLTMFAQSKPMAVRMEEAEANRLSGATKTKKKRRLTVATLDDYVDCSSLVMVKIAVQSNQVDVVRELTEVGISNADEVVNTAVKLHSLLVARRLPIDTEIIAVCGTGGTGIDEVDGIVNHVCGHYYGMNTQDDRPTYQKLQLTSTCHSGVACHGLYITWSDAFEGVWKIGMLGNKTAGLVINKDNQAGPQVCKLNWRVYRAGASARATS